MAEIIPIELSLTDGNGVTLWAPRWEEDGEEWEAFLGHEENLYVFSDAAHVAGFVRTNNEHDLADHPDWELARRSLADEFVPDDDHRFDIVGIPELVSQRPDVWSLAELADTVAILRSLAEVCDLPVIDEVLDSAPGFAAAAQGATAFIGRAGGKLWHQIGTAVAKRWDEVVEALDAIVTTPEVDADALAAAQAEIDAVSSAEADLAPDADEAPEDASDEVVGKGADERDSETERDPDLDFWDEVGIDCIKITAGGRTGWTLRCYLDDAAVFLTESDQIQLFSSPAALEEYLSELDSTNSLASLDAYGTIREAIAGGEASVIAGSENTYRLDGLDKQLLAGPAEVDAEQLELAIELLTDAGQARGDEETAAALSTASPLGNLLRAATNPDPDRLPPSPPFDDEVAAWSALVTSLTAGLRWR